VHDSRLLAQVKAGQRSLAEALVSLRSRAGFEGYLTEGLLANVPAVTQALARTNSPVTQAYLLPLAPQSATAQPVCSIEHVILNRLQSVAAGSPLHLSLVEIIRRRYIAFRKDADKADKEAIRTRLG